MQCWRGVRNWPWSTNSPTPTLPARAIPNATRTCSNCSKPGIDVFTTLNVQHVESRAEAVRQITGIAIRETLPDSVLDGAEFELVDLPPEELRSRLAAGKVYVPESARAAQEHFFRPGNLSALRELALRFAAEHVGQDVLAYRQAHGVGDPWKSGQRLLVAVSASPTSASLVRWTRRLAGELQAPWLAVYVELPHPLNEDEQARLARHLALARELGAQVITTTDADVARRAPARGARAKRDSTGGRQTGGLARFGFAARRLALEPLDPGKRAHRRACRARGRGNASVAPPGQAAVQSAAVLQSYGAALGVVAGVTGLNAVLQHWLGNQPVALIYLLSVVILAMFVGRGPTLAAATLTALLWDFFFTEPRLQLPDRQRGRLQ